MDNNKLKDLVKDPEFMKKLVNAGNVEAVQTLLAQYQVELTKGDIEEMIALKNSNEELSEDELNSVAGGVIWLPVGGFPTTSWIYRWLMSLFRR